MKASDLTPEEGEEIIRDMKKQYPDFELRDDAEIDYWLFPLLNDPETTDGNEAKHKPGPRPRTEEAK